MKQVTYEIRGLVIETMIPAIKASCESLAGVRNVRVAALDTDTARLTLVVDGLLPETERYVYGLPEPKSITVDGQSVAETAVEMLFDRISNPEIPFRHRVLPVRLHENGTTRAIQPEP